MTAAARARPTWRGCGARASTPLSDEQGLALFDQALVAELPLSLAVPLDRAGLRAQAAAGVLPPLLRGLVRAPARRRSAARRLARAPGSPPCPRPSARPSSWSWSAPRPRRCSATAPPRRSSPTRAFKELGFDSLAAVELRNRLERRHRPAPAGDARLRLPELGGAGGAGSRCWREARSPARVGGETARWRRDSTVWRRCWPGSSPTPGARKPPHACGHCSAGVDGEQDADLADASDEEMFELLDKKLGRI